MEHPDSNQAAAKARRLRRIAIVRGRHRWQFVCTEGEEAHLLRSAVEAHHAQKSALRALDLLILARELGLATEALNPPVRKAD